MWPAGSAADVSAHSWADTPGRSSARAGHEAPYPHSPVFVALPSASCAARCVLPFYIDTARVAGALTDRARAAGRSPGLADVAVAATAASRRLVLLTRNLRRFGPLEIPAHDPFDSLPRAPGTPLADGYAACGGAASRSRSFTTQGSSAFSSVMLASKCP